MLLYPRKTRFLLSLKDLRKLVIDDISSYFGVMNTVWNLLMNLRKASYCLLELLGYLITFLWALFSARAAVEDPGPMGRLCSAHEAGYGQEMAHHSFRVFWRWKSGCKPGRPSVPRQLQDLIRQLSRENPLWGAERIWQTLLLLGYDPPCEDTIRKYMVKSRNPRPKPTTWLPFLRNHLDVSWAIDFFTVTTIRFATLYTFLVFDHGRRKVLHFATTYNPSMPWVVQQLRETMPFGRQPRYLFRDNDRLYGNPYAG